MTNSQLAAHFRTLVTYDPKTGLFHWLQDRGRARTGDIAGSVMRSGHRRIRIDGHAILAHRLAWLITHDAMPEHEIDHINGDPDDNRITNLRDATRTVNRQNIAGPNRNNRLGWLGVRKSGTGRFISTISTGTGDERKNHHLGTFDTPEEAHAAYLEAKGRLHPYSERLSA